MKQTIWIFHLRLWQFFPFAFTKYVNSPKIQNGPQNPDHEIKYSIKLQTDEKWVKICFRHLIFHSIWLECSFWMKEWFGVRSALSGRVLIKENVIFFVYFLVSGSRKEKFYRKLKRVYVICKQRRKRTTYTCSAIGDRHQTKMKIYWIRHIWNWFRNRFYFRAKKQIENDFLCSAKVSHMNAKKISNREQGV